MAYKLFLQHGNIKYTSIPACIILLTCFLVFPFKNITAFILLASIIRLFNSFIIEDRGKTFDVNNITTVIIMTVGFFSKGDNSLLFLLSFPIYVFLLTYRDSYICARLYNHEKSL